ncbi:arginine-fifty homeobox [Trichechus manatus latirostris]|uniref:Arginine-fifty homeobox n=1 Tax=Trichechus manatus latirostris TaxID=127582 RepID=A0A2Y9DFS8_TRIMA|nr:arginine-fifty homeobox [Trichechus manatus latirostris]
MNRMAPENPKPYPFVNMDDPSMNLIPQNPADPTIWRKRQERTLFTHKQHEELEALFSHTMFPDKNLCMELALKFNVQESKVKVWFRNQRFKMRKQQQQHQQSLKKPRQITPAKKNVSTSPRASTNPYSFSPMVSDCYSSLPPQPLGASNWAQDSVFTWNPTSDVQMQEPQLERLVASVPALYSDAYDIAQIMELYSFPDEDVTSICSFSCLYQYLSPTRPQLERRGPALSIFADPAVGLSPGETWSSMTNTGFVADSLRDSLEFQNPSSMVDSRFQ